MAGFVDWIANRALPVWSTAGFDDAAGRFRERLDRWAGEPVDVPHRAMVQARQIYVFAHSALLGWFGDGAPLAERAMAALLRDFHEESGEQASFAFSVDTRGTVVSPARDAYTHAFVLFALAWLYRLNGDRSLLTLAERTLRFVDTHIVDSVHGGLFDTANATDRSKRQNPVMHLLEACLSLEEVAPGHGFLERSASLVRLFRETLFDPSTNVLREHFSESWTDHSDYMRSRLWEPGHHFEWVWLLHQYGQRTGEDLGNWTEPLYRSACDRGIAQDGLIFDEMAVDGPVLKQAHRVWPHTEAIKAAVARHAAGDGHASDFAESMAAALMRTFLDRPFAGGWIDHVDDLGKPLVDYVPASSLYHLFLAGSEATRNGPEPHDCLRAMPADHKRA